MSAETELLTSPSEIAIDSTEARPVNYDTTPELLAGESALSAVVTLTDLATGVSYVSGLMGSASVAANVVTQWLHNGTPGHKWRLKFIVAVTGGKTLTSSCIVSCPW